MLMNGSVHRLEAGETDPTIVKFERYAFDLSRFTGGAAAAGFGVRERNLWDVAFPDADDPIYKQIADRISAPSCMTASSRRSIRSRSRCSALRSSARRAPAGRAARCRSS